MWGVCFQMAADTWEFIQKIFLIAGGLGLFLYGMKIMSDGLENIAGDRMRQILEKATSNRFFGVITGTAVTMIIQSSSATTVMVVGFVNANLMSLSQAIGVIMGANIGTTITAQMISFRIDAIAPLIIFVGLVLFLAVKKRTVKNTGYILLGFGILFFGISVMGGQLKEFAGQPGFQTMLTAFDNPMLAMLVGMVFTAIIQSSSATTGIVVALYLSGVSLPFGTAAFLVLGSNIGTCITALLASLTANRESKRAALAHILFNVFGCIIVGSLITIFPGILSWIQSLTPGDGARQIANFHTLFNVATAVLLIGFIRQLNALVHKIIPEKLHESVNTKRLIYLDLNIMQTPAIAVTQAHRELCRMGRMAGDNLQRSLDAFYEKDSDKAAKVLEIEDTINFLNHQITVWLVKMRGLDLSEADIERLGMMLHTVSDIERIGDHAENIAEYALMEEHDRVKLSQAAMDALHTLSEAAMAVLTLALDIFESRDESCLSKVAPLEDRVDNLSKEYVEQHIQRLKDAVCDPKSGVVFTDMVSDLERCADHATNIAYSILGETVWDARGNKLMRVTEMTE